MDKSQHSKLTKVFEQAAEQEAQANPLPEQLWQNIAQELSTTPPVESGKRIQKAFEEQSTPALPPVDLWGNIAEGLNQNKVKESFEGQTVPAAPAAVWEDIEQQLEIETVWKKIHKALDKRSNWLYWREKAVQGSLVLLVLLWLRGCDWGEQPQPPVVSTPVAIAAKKAPTKATTLVGTNNNNKQSTTNKKITDAEMKTLPSTVGQVPSIAKKTTPTTRTNPATRASRSSEQIAVKHKTVEQIGSTTQEKERTASLAIAKEAVNSFEGQDLPAAKKKPLPIAEVFMQPKEAIGSTPINALEATDNVGQQKTLHTTNLSTAAANTSIDTPLEFSKEGTNNKNNTVAQAPVLMLQNRLIDAAKVPTVPTPKEVNNPSIVALEAIDLQRIQLEHQQQTHIEFGIQGRILGTVLLGNMTTEAMERSSMVKTRVLPTGSVGANLAWYFTRNDAVIVALYPMANSRQYFGGYTEEGRYYNKEIKLSYFDVEAAYQRTLWHYNDFGVLPSSFYARVSYGFGYLNKGETILDGMVIDETVVYNKTNHSLGLALGNTHQIKRWVIDYGIYGRTGLSTLHRQQPTDYRHLLGVGAYLGLRYSL